MSEQNRIIARQGARGSLFPMPGSVGAPGKLSGLGDYNSDLYWRTLKNQNGNEGPLTTPAVQGPEVVPNDAMKACAYYLIQIRDLLEQMPYQMANEFRTRFAIKPREAVSFTVPSAPTAVAAGAAVAICSVTLDERFTGFLESFGVNVVGGGFSNITWQLRVGGQIHPRFKDLIFSAGNLATPIPFLFELVQGRTLQLVAINTGGGIETVSGVLNGWTEYMASYKSYGASPSTGIA